MNARLLLWLWQGLSVGGNAILAKQDEKNKLKKPPLTQSKDYKSKDFRGLP